MKGTCKFIIWAVACAAFTLNALASERESATLDVAIYGATPASTSKPFPAMRST